VVSLSVARAISIGAKCDTAALGRVAKPMRRRHEVCRRFQLKALNDRESVAHPTRFERVTFAFGGRFFEFATFCGRLQACKKPPFRSGFLVDDVARFC
jgi:hypothetical protein